MSTCEECNGTREVSATIGGDGYGDRCAGEMDIEGPCPYCTPEGIAWRRECEMLYLPRRLWSEDWTK